MGSPLPVNQFVSEVTPMTRERMVGILLGISIGTVIGYYLRPARTAPQAHAEQAVETVENIKEPALVSHKSTLPAG